MLKLLTAVLIYSFSPAPPGKNPVYLDAGEVQWLKSTYPQPVQANDSFYFSHPGGSSHFIRIKIPSYSHFDTKQRLAWTLDYAEQYRQTCALFLMENDFTYFGTSRNGEGFFNTARQFQSLRDVRDSVILLIKNNLYLIHQANTLKIIQDLNATELLPYLLLDFENNVKLRGQATLSTILTLLRQEKYPPVLASGWEKDFKEKISAYRAHYASDEAYLNIPADRREWSFLDPIYGIPGTLGEIKIAYEPKNIQPVVTWALNFLKEVPDSSRLNHKGMITWPVMR